MRTNYMMTVEDVMNELGVKRSKAYSILKQLNNELEKEGTLYRELLFHYFQNVEIMKIWE